MPRYFKLETKTFCSITNERDPDNEWSRDSTSEHTTIQGLCEVGEKDHPDFSVPDDATGPFYLVYGVYDTGNSFGRDEGQFEAVMLHTDEAAARENVRRIEEQNRFYCKNNGNGKALDLYSVELVMDDGTPFRFSVPWNGFFEELRCADIEVVHVLGGKR